MGIECLFTGNGKSASDEQDCEGVASLVLNPFTQGCTSLVAGRAADILGIYVVLQLPAALTWSYLPVIRKKDRLHGGNYSVWRFCPGWVVFAKCYRLLRLSGPQWHRRINDQCQ